MTAPRWDDPGPVVPRSAQPLSYSPVLRIDPERVEGMVGRLEGVIREVAEIERTLDVLFVAAPANDEVSRNASKQSAAMINHARAYLARWRQDLMVAGAAVAAQAQGYAATEGTFASRT
ncbi:PE domain-containing protein [Pseudonocardia kujensis]|uniref:PE domain-containing protein n=1 Tax=Pseudonocardia kujensis TaxID=1128675 RepID=UPI001E3E7FA2|nr:PE domain-containing protein [Pseudonocardia kujensis]MCE0765605.1 PE domain-containing protein [Pseudonocardia kujensis]